MHGSRNRLYRAAIRDSRTVVSIPASMSNPWAHRCAILVAVLVLIVLALGALLTSEIRTLPGSTAPSAVSEPVLEQVHVIAGFAATLLAILVAVWALRSNLLRSMAGLAAVAEVAAT